MIEDKEHSRIITVKSMGEEIREKTRCIWKIIPLIALLILSLNLCYAIGFDNVIGSTNVGKGQALRFGDKDISYNPIWEKYKPVEVVNAWGLGSKLMEGYIDKHTDTCGTSCSSEFTIKLYTRGSLVDDVRFKRLVDGNWVGGDIRNYKLYLQTDEEKVDVNDYEWTCVDVGYSLNGTKKVDCSNELVGTHKESKPIWEEYVEGGIVEAGTYTLKLEGEKRSDWTYDWVIRTQGNWIEDWAVWGAGNSYYFYDDFSAENTTLWTQRDAQISIVGGELVQSQADVPPKFWRTGHYTIADNSLINFTARVYTSTSNPYYCIGFGVMETTAVVGNGTTFCYNGQTPADTEIEMFYRNITSKNRVLLTATITSLVGGYHILTILSNQTETGYYIDGALKNKTTNRNINLSGMVEFGGWREAKVDWLSFNVTAPVFSKIAQNSPADSYTSTTNLVTFNCSARVTGATFSNLSLWTNQSGSFVMRNSTTTNGALMSSTFSSDAKYIWNCRGCDSDGDCGFSSANRTLTIDTTPPTLNVTYPTGTLTGITNGQNMTLNYTVSDANLQACWYEYNAINYTLACRVNSTFIYSLGKNSIRIWANDTLGNLGNHTENWTSTRTINSVSYNETSYETATETYSINVSGATTVNLVYNGTSYDASYSGGIGTKSLTLTSLGNKSIYWRLDGGIYNSTIYYQNVRSINLSLCDYSSASNVTYLNVTFKDETLDTYINASADQAYFTSYYIGDGSVTKSWIYTNTTDNFNYPICFSPGDRTVHAVLDTFQYSATGYPQRQYYFSGDLTNSTTQKVLYLLGSGDGIYSSFQTATSMNNPISGVNILIERQFAGVWTTVGQGISDSAGLSTFWVNPNYDLRITATKTGYTSQQVTIRPTQTTYTIVMSSSGSNASYSSSLEGITWSYEPSVGIITPGVSTNFNVTIASSKANIVSCQFTLSNSTNSSLASTTSSCGASGGTLYLIYTPQDGEKLWGTSYIDIGGGLFILDSDAYWIGYDQNISSGAGLKGFFNELFILNEFGGGVEQEFSRIIWAFLIITIILCAIAIYSGSELANPGSVMLIIAPLLLFFGATGWFKFSGLVKQNSIISAGASVWLNNYIYIIIVMFFIVGWAINYWRRNN